MKLVVPYLKMRPGPNGDRPRWEPGPALRKAGFSGRDLKDDLGEWLSEEAAIAKARALNAEVEEWKKTGKAKVGKPLKKKHPRSCQQLFELWSGPKHVEFGLLGKNTQDDYITKARQFLNIAIDPKTGDVGEDVAGGDTFADIHVGAITRRHLKNLWRELYRDRGHAMANGVLRVVSIMMTFAVDEEWRRDNPASKLKIKQTAPRQVLWLPDELELIVKTADEMGKFSIGDAVIVALHAGQRQGDTLALPERIFDESRVRLSQLKSNGKARIDAPMTPALLARLAEIKARRAGGKVHALDRPLIQRDTDGTPHDDRHYFGKQFRLVRDAAADKMGEDGKPLCPHIADKNFQDLRDTAVTRLALAGCTLPEIAAITGHDTESITRIIKHYLVLQPAMADAAIGKLTAWLEREAIAI
jgi:integrase